MNRRGLITGAAAAAALPRRPSAQCILYPNPTTIPTFCGDVPLGPAPSLDLPLTGPTLDPRITFTRASTATYFDATGTLQTAAANTPRFDYDPVAHAPRGLLIEEARTNLLLNSAVLSTQSVTTTAVATTLSFYGTGTITKSGTATGALVGAGAFPARATQTFTPTAGTLTLTVSGSVLDAQLEAGSSTSYIPTAGAAATRAADVATMPTAAWFNAAQGTLVAEGVLPFANATRTSYWANLSDGTTANTISLYVSATAQNVAALTVASSLNGSNGIAAPLGTVNKSAIAYTAGANLNAFNGASDPSGTLGASAVPSGIARLDFGNRPDAARALDGWVRRVSYWSRTLSNAELQQVTT